MDSARDHLQGLAAWHRQGLRDRARWALLAEPGALFAIVDVAREPELLELLHASGEAYCAIDETREPDDTSGTAPVLVAVTPGASTLAMLLEETLGAGSMVFFTSDLGFREVYRHVLLRAGADPVATAPRFWDPAVLRALLASVDADAHGALFGPIRAFVVEALTPDALERFEWTGHAVARATLSLS